MRDEIEAVATFVVVAETLSFRRAAERLGVTRSAVSQAIRKLEEHLGIALFHRTTRSVHLTEAGMQLLQVAGPSLSDLRGALRTVAEAGGRPGGRLRLAVSSIAESFLDGAALAGFLITHPEIRLDVVVTDAEFDIVAEGYDAGVRLGEVIEADMIAVPVSADQRQLAVASPDYIARAGAPAHPRDLVDHHCIGWRPSPDVAPYRWEFTVDGRDVSVEVDPHVTTNDMAVMVRLARAGVGITCGLEETFRPYLMSGALLPVLEEFCAPFPGFFLYYPSRRTMAGALRSLVDYLKRSPRPLRNRDNSV
ncbi:LysR family transcriptional regulator [Enterovirga sp. CN4-39]|uniref:LysR family transcriptional regulator n=1 Tax=Enterovirga sp. CN4-39 TaxID=3400910 RepID=UPI003BFF505F